jgi:hypothetical protein
MAKKNLLVDLNSFPDYFQGIDKVSRGVENNFNIVVFCNNANKLKTLESGPFSKMIKKAEEAKHFPSILCIYLGKKYVEYEFKFRCRYDIDRYEIVTEQEKYGTFDVGEIEQKLQTFKLEVVKTKGTFKDDNENDLEPCFWAKSNKCNYYCANKDELLKHYENDHPYVCNVCKSRCRTENYLNEHNKKQMVCEYCPSYSLSYPFRRQPVKIFCDTEKFQSHLDENHPKCDHPYCFLYFLFSHADCKCNGRRYESPAKLQHHQTLINSWKKNTTQCNIGTCTYRLYGTYEDVLTNKNKDYKEHKRYWHPDKCFKCKKCNELFASKNAIAKHKKTCRKPMLKDEMRNMFKTPNNKEVWRECIDERLVPTEFFLKHVKFSTNVIVKALHKIKPKEVFRGGSTKKRTIRRGTGDVDIVIYFDDYDPTDSKVRETYLRKIKEIISTIPGIEDVEEKSPFCIGCKFASVEFDLLPAAKLTDQNRRSFEKEPAAWPSFSQEQTEWVKKKLCNQYDFEARNTVRLLKAWRDEYYDTWGDGKGPKSKGPKSYLLEILVCKTLEQIIKHDQKKRKEYEEKSCNRPMYLFKCVMERMGCLGDLFDPTNSGNNIGKNTLSEKVKEQITQRSKEVLELLQQAS